MSRSRNSRRGAKRKRGKQTAVNDADRDRFENFAGNKPKVKRGYKSNEQ